jgi:hypothetical protein
MSAAIQLMRLVRHAGFATLGLLAGGCSTLGQFANAGRAEPAYAPSNVQAANQIPAEIRRVAVLPVYCGPVVPEETGLALDAALFAALQKQMRFEVVVVGREEMRRRFGAPEYSSSGVLPHGFLEAVGEAHSADAVLFVDLTAYRPIRPLEVGYRAKLATVREVRLLWSFDEALTAADPAVARGARKSLSRGDRRPAPYDLGPTMLQNPARFAAYVAEEMFATLPPR